MADNPYAAPRAAVADVAPEKPRRPVLVWLICIVMGLGTLGSIASSGAGLAGVDLGVPLTRFDHFVSLVAAVIAAVSVVELFRLKRRALPLFAISLAITLVALLAGLASQPEYREMLISTPAWFLAGAWIINFAILGYMGWLRRKGTLQ